jgi:hypothetical protein
MGAIQSSLSVFVNNSLFSSHCNRVQIVSLFFGVGIADMVEHLSTKKAYLLPKRIGCFILSSSA